MSTFIALCSLLLGATAVTASNNTLAMRRSRCRPGAHAVSSSIIQQAMFAEHTRSAGPVIVHTEVHAVTITLDGNGNRQNDAAQTTTSPKPAAQTQQPVTVQSNDNDDGTAGSTVDAAERKAWLDAHNAARAQHGARPVKWDLKAEKQAVANAELHKGTCELIHTPDGPRQYGENLASGTGMTPQWAVDMYMGEAKDYNYNNPVLGGGTGHFTQVVWKETTGIGCATRKCGNGQTYTACGYNPGGNMPGDFPDNVMRKGTPVS